MYIFTQLYALLHKDIWILRIKRHYCTSLFELLMPLFVVGMLSSGLNKAAPETSGRGMWYNATIYPPKEPYTAEQIKFPMSAGRQTSRIHIIYAPRTKYTTHIVESVFNLARNVSITGFVGSKDLEVYLAKINGSVDLSIIFRSVSQPSHLSYTLQYGFGSLMPSGNALGDFASPRTPRSIMEETLLFPTMYAVFKEHAKFYKLKINARLDPIRPFPTDRYYFRKAGMKKDQSAEDATFIRMSDMIILFSFITFICSFSKGIVAEKETRLREIMRMMGLPDIVYWINCMLVGTIRGGLIAVILMICLCDFGVAQVFVYSDASVIVLFFIVFTMAIVNFSLLFTVPFSSPKIMVFVVFIVQVGTVAMIVTYVDDPAGGLTGYMSLTVPFKLATSLVPQIGIHWLMKLASFSEQKGEGLQWHNINQAVIPGDNIAPIEIIYAMLLSWLLYLLLAMYLDAINPWQYGNANHPLFFLLPSYWCPTVADFSHKASVRNSNKEMIENISKKLRVVVRLVQISHRFGPIRALSNLSVDLYCNQITMLLGHNGAGKTTLMSILTGLIQPDHGEVFINGYSVRKHTRKARESLGFCPQHNVLFDKLTVMEHLVFFGKLKDAEENYLRQEIKHLLSELDLTQKSNSFSKDLSGGMKRKLCLANAMVGGSEIVILDEPTAGMDPEARRAVWGLLQDERRYRTILMTTHYMEEADVLGDRIVFVAKGRLLAAGSPMFLKKKFETGYNLRLSKKSLDVNTARVVAVIKRCLPGNDIVNLDSDIGYEFVVNIGFPSPQQLVELFRYLEDNLSTLGIHSIGISITTMEDVFHKVGEYGEAKSKDGIFSRDSEKFDFTFTEEFKRPFFIPEGHHLSRLRLKALLKKRWLVGRREWRTLFYLGIVPALATMFYCSSTGTNLTDNLQKPITYSLSQIARNPIAFVTKKQDGVVRNFVKALKSEQVEIKTLNPGQDIGKYLLGIASSEPANYKSRWVAGGEYDGRNRVLWYNGEPYHVGGAALATWQGAMLAEATRDPTAIVNVTGLPPASARVQNLLHSVVVQFQIRFMASVGVTFAVSYMLCNAVVLPIEERVAKVKLVQIMTGLPRWLYVFSNAVFDLLSMFVTVTIMVAIFVLVDPSNVYAVTQNLAALIAVLTLFCFSMLPQVYIITYIIDDSATGLSVVQYLTLIPGIGLGIVIAMFELIAILTNEALLLPVKLGSLIPTFAVSWAISSIRSNTIGEKLCETVQGSERIIMCRMLPELYRLCCQPCPEGGPNICYAGQRDAFAFDTRFGCGLQIVCMTSIGLMGWVFLSIMELYYMKTVDYLENLKNNGLRGFRMLWHRNDQSGTMLFGPEDPDVVGERFQVEQAIDTNSTREYAMVVHELTKYYGTFLAVNKISFLVNKKECFGLLGVNGAGKTTTFSMLSGDLSVSSGTAYIRDQQLHNNVQGFQKLIGYCPQQNVLIDSMTGNEMLRLFCALRGVDTDQTDAIIELIVRLTDLSSHADKLTYNYSGGTKRKLCVGLAIVGNPPLLFLDEPTAGIDPTARRKIWGTLTALQREIGSSCMLTSHSMEECEALCQRIAIMVAGSIRCIGSSPDLKLKFSHGFTVLVKLAVDSPQQEKAVIHFMQSVFPSGCRLKQSYQRLLTFHVSKATLRWSVVFERIMTMRNDPALEIEDVQVSDTSLEEIFLSFANRGTFTVNADMSTRSESSSEKLEPSDASETQPAIERDQEDLSDSNSDTVEIIGGRSISKRKRMPLWVLERLPDHHGDGDPDPDSPHIHPVVPRSSMPTNVPPVPRKILADQADLKPHRLEAGKTRKTPSSPTAADVGGNENAEVLRTSRRHPISEKYDVLPKEGITKNARNLASSQSESTDGKNQLQHPIKLFAAHKNDIVKPFSASKRPSKESLDKGKQPLTLAYSLATTNSDQTRTSPTSTPSSDTVESKRIHSIALPDSYQ
ncbi:ATP-binding cassette sub-family A member 3-like isoform X3 [Varroa destructor]|uniref:ABC transporter domain-containing protein n=1 Tax=Varroa destructor TaxID=109461 RepID=A0A7M7KPL7_VARDE|nr:ATP-binding cassette sub-family A member 3-like isoform X3 [Varroa destructor]